MKAEMTPETTYLKDYKPSPFLVTDVELTIDIGDKYTTVISALTVVRNLECPAAHTVQDLVLDGVNLELVRVEIDNVLLTREQYEISDECLTIKNVPASFVLSTEVRVYPEKNTSLEGLYASKDGYFTQCEAQGFRRITYFLDRPDIMARYQTTIIASQARFPILLSNGNCVSKENIGENRHSSTWVDPFPKPSYLFAVVAADLDKVEGAYETVSGKKVKLLFYVEPGKADQCGYALESLKAAIKWDEEVFGLELDLEQYMIVAVSDFNMGAMENKGLNIFNTKYVLARPDTATDTDFMMLDRVVAHEYFHNWTGNRVTCRDWFQLSLKEGLTVFRDQQYGGDRYSHAVQRIQEVRLLRSAQFPEDAGPMAHAVRPDSYIEISNFYTATVYNKGAEVVRMIHTLVGGENFRAGMDLYFQRHDGQAVRIEEFVRAMQDASGVDLEQFQLWYSQAGTPSVKVNDTFDEEKCTYTLHFTQSYPEHSALPARKPTLIPIEMGLIDSHGQEMQLSVEGTNRVKTGGTIALTDAEQSFTFKNINERPVPSLLRSFSAPVNLTFDYADQDLAHLAVYDVDPFNRWEAIQRLSTSLLLENARKIQSGALPEYNDVLSTVFSKILRESEQDPGFAAETLGLPGATYLAEQMKPADPEAILLARIGLRLHLAKELEDLFSNVYISNDTPGKYSPDPDSSGKRSLKNSALGYLMELDTPQIRARCFDQLICADNLTDGSAALISLANNDCEERTEGLKWFYERWKDEALVLDKWFAVQATSRLPNTLEKVKILTEHPKFDIKNPNKVRAVIGAFCQGNHALFHSLDGSGYSFAADKIIELDNINAQIAARLCRAFDRWRIFDTERQHHAQNQLERIAKTSNLSKDTFEVVSKCLG